MGKLFLSYLYIFESNAILLHSRIDIESFPSLVASIGASVIIITMAHWNYGKIVPNSRESCPETWSRCVFGRQKRDLTFNFDEL